ncbi:MAG: hypothetical protein H6510_11305 [Acidobacteria bacterium]|nr:hypothetical protein [Acidobacteriota bacterium]MCB9398392.1 hypothetical protein [Acidobacteriota bacterium]
MFSLLVFLVVGVPTGSTPFQGESYFLLEARGVDAQNQVAFYYSSQFLCGAENEPRAYALPFKQYIADTYAIPITKIGVRYWKGSEEFISGRYDQQTEKLYEAREKVVDTNWDGCQ